MLALLVVMFIVNRAVAQQLPDVTEQQLEMQTDAGETAEQDDSDMQDLEKFRTHPLNLNTADEQELESLRLLTPVQVSSLITYRQLLGSLISIYELQAVPYWDPALIRKLLPYCTVETAAPVMQETASRFSKGEHQLLLRYSQQLERAAGYRQPDGSSTGYRGSTQQLQFRYRYQYKDLLQFGLTGDKDAGEQFLKGAQKAGFDFYSFHFFIRKLGRIRELAIGDFTVNMGQGLVEWQGLAFRKSAAVISISRQSPVLKPYRAAGEFYFHRGAGITYGKGRMELTTFLSARRLNANRVFDSTGNTVAVSSLLSSGYNRTEGELADRHALGQYAAGASLLYKHRGIRAGLHGVHYTSTLRLQKQDEPYNLYAINGRNWWNAGLSYSMIKHNMYVFGEAAICKTGDLAILQGIQLSVDQRADLAVLFRKIAPGYQSINGNAFTESTRPSNEQGWYLGLSIRPAAGWKLDLYADLYTYPWLRYRADAPSGGNDFLVQLTCAPTRQAEWYTRFRYSLQSSNETGSNSPVSYLQAEPVQNWRTQVNLKLNRSFTVRTRLELQWYRTRQAEKESGYLALIDFLYKPLKSPVGVVARLQYVETANGSPGIYAYENDVLYSYSIPSNTGRGYRYYLLINADLGKRMSAWMRLAQTVYPGLAQTGSGAEMAAGPAKTLVKLQLRYLF